MPRLALAAFCALACALVTIAADTQPTPVEKQLTIQAAMASARKSLDIQRPADAIAILEKELVNADGNKAFLNLLREAYLAELYQLEKNPDTNAEQLSQTRRKLALLGSPSPKVDSPPPAVLPPVPSAPSTDPSPSLVQPVGGLQPSSTPSVEDAVAAFKRGDFAKADTLFTAIGAAKLTTEHKTAWAYCRIKLAADRVNSPTCDAATATTAAQEVADALELISDNAKLLASGRAVLKAAQAKAKAAPPSGGATVTPILAADGIETASFRVHHGGNRDLGESVAKAAEASRKQIFERWSGPPGGAWQPKCEIVIHATADAYAKATGRSASLTGHATVRLTNGRATERRIDLRADDPAMIDNALPRELTHVILADLFAKTPPPKWAEEGMAILAGSPEEIGRYTRTLPRCAREGEIRTLHALFNLNEFPTDKITGFYCESVSVTEYLIKLNGERHFKIFLSVVQRYGVAQALKQQYGFNSPQALEEAWKRDCLEPIR